MKSASHKNKIWPAAGSSSTYNNQQQLRIDQTTTTGEDEEQIQHEYYPPPTPHHRYMVIPRSGSMMSSREYWEARRAFLSSYSFTAEKGGGLMAVADMDWVKQKGKVWVKEAKEAAVGFSREVKRMRVVVKGFRFTLVLPSFVVIRMRCFTPWISSERSEFGSRYRTELAARTPPI